MRFRHLLAALVVSAVIGAGSGGCASLSNIFTPTSHVDDTTLAQIELTLNVAVNLADAYTNCGRPDAVPCPNGAAKSDLATVNELAALIEAAHSAVVKVRQGSGTLALVGAAVAAVTAYEASHGIHNGGW